MVDSTYPPPYALLQHSQACFPDGRCERRRLRFGQSRSQSIKSPYPETIPMAIQESAQLAETVCHDFIRAAHAFIKQFEIVGQNDKCFTPGFQSLPEQAL